MKKFIALLITSCIMLFVSLSMGEYVRYTLRTSKPYTVRIINGSPNLCYEAKLQVDSFKIFSSKCAFVYANGNFLKINAELITITKN
jgi:hypothetical protein